MSYQYEDYETNENTTQNELDHEHQANHRNVSIPEIGATSANSTGATLGHTRVSAPQSYYAHTNNTASFAAQPSNAYHQNYNEQNYGYGQSTEAYSRGTLQKVITVVASIIYWPVALIGVSAPFMSGFNHGNLHTWQTVFSRFWLAFILLGFVYALIVNLGGIRTSRLFDGARPVKIAIALAADVALSFVLIRVICLL